jgi:hypothetical protein
MAIVPIQIGKNFVEYVLLDGGSMTDHDRWITM